MKKLSTLVTFIRVLIVLALIGAPLLYAMQHQNAKRNFRVVHEGVLYRSGQMTIDGLERVMHDYGIQTVISLRFAREEGQPPPDAEEEAYCKKHGIRYVRLYPGGWLRGENERAPVDDEIDKFFQVMEEERARGKPVLIHCYAGVHRSGSFCALYRMKFQGWNNSSALAELEALGYDNLDKEADIRGYLQAYPKGRSSK